jgi:glucose-1-phosphate thymidylyltransferase
MQPVTTKALILARGLGTRMRREDAHAEITSAQAEVAATGVKALIPIGRPFLDYVLSAVADARIREVCLIVGPEQSALRERYERLAMTRVRVDFAVQQEPRGTADAVLAGEAWTAGAPFLVLNSDNYYPASALADLAACDEPALVAFSRQGLIAGGISPTRAASFAVLELDGDYLSRIVEKPSEPELARLGHELWVSMNCWRFDARILRACRDVPVSSRGELELPQAVGLAMRRGDMRVRAIRESSAVLDLSSRADIATVKERLSGVEVRL